VFYYNDKASGTFLASDSFFNTLNVVKENDLSFSIDSLGVKMMLWHRMFYDNLTYVNEVKFLRPFEYLALNDGSLELKKMAFPQMINISMEEAANEIHQRFNKAVMLQYKKNEQANYHQVTTLSGGMDCRSTFLYGLANGYVDQFGFCYGESTSVDHDYAQKLAAKHHCEFFFHSIDNGEHLLKREDLSKANEGQMVYSGSSGVFDSLRFYDTSRWGIVHTGLGGGEIMGDMRVADNPTKWEQRIESLKYRFGKGKKDRTWTSFITSLRCNVEEKKRLEDIYKYYGDFNLFHSLNDIRRCLNGQKVALSFGVEYVSPFLYEDFFCYMLQIPYSLTKDRELYVYWQKKYNSQQFEIPSTFQLGCRPENKLGYYAIRFYCYFMNKLGKKTKYDMIPVEHWMSKNPNISKTQEEWFEMDMGSIRTKVNDSICQLILDSWNLNVAPRMNILTATWALDHIYKVYKK
jgi:asparagine synthetase B (glutamine-hydrolysing)